MRGIDYAGPHSNYAEIKAQVGFVCRYLSRPGNPKNATKAECAGLHAAGVGVVLVFETTADRAKAGRTAGVADATSARAQANALGAPHDLPLYFAVDIDTTVTSLIAAYFQGVASVLGKQATGGYGGYRVVKGLFDKGLITYGWQTYAWSGGKWDARAQLRQVQNGVRVAGISCDWDEAVSSDFGMWLPAVAKPTKTPTKAPAPRPAAPTLGAGIQRYHDRLPAQLRTDLGRQLASEEPCLPGKGRVARFAKGDIYWTSSTHAHLVFGGIRKAYARAGGPAGYLGYPTSDETAAAGGRQQTFQRGTLTDLAGKVTATHLV